MHKGIFITGTDTGVGKTLVGMALARALKADGIDIGVMKPAETGCRERQGRLVPRDALQLIKAARVRDPLALVNPFRFRAQLAPLVAAEQEGKRIELKGILSAYRTLAQRHRFLLVEGAGGIMVPLDRRSTYLDLASRLKLPILIVARPNLGTINHTVLTVRAVRAQGLRIAGVIMNDAVGSPCRIAERTNPDIVEHMIGIPVLCSLRHGQRDLPDVVVQRIVRDDY